MKRIVTSAQAKEIDRYSMEELGMPGIVLMERAAMRFTERFLEYWEVQKDSCQKRKLIVVCGSGNNGGDGMAAARMLFEKGFDCSVYLAGNPEKMTESARIQWELLEKLEVPLLSEFAPETGTWIIDALFGVGLSREVAGHYAHLIEEMNQFRCFAVDLPSGLNADNGQAMAVCGDGTGYTAVKAEMTVTFGPVKAGLLLGNGRQYAGTVYAEEIGFPQKAVDRIQKGAAFAQSANFHAATNCQVSEASVTIPCGAAFAQSANFHAATNCQVSEASVTIPCGWHLEDRDLPSLLPERRDDSNKGTYGRLLVFAGSETMIGAAYYAALAAYRTGAGLVEIVTDGQNLPVLAGMLPGAVYTKAETLFLAEDEEALEKKMDTASSVVLGPGLGQSDQAEHIVETVLRLCRWKKKRLVLDADGLNLLAKHREWYGLLDSHMVLTPHVKEMSRLSGWEVSKIKNDMIASAMGFSRRYGTVLLLKDSRSVITDGTDYWINQSGNHGMAVGGSGDILSGILGGLLAQPQAGRSILEIAALSAYLHGKAGDAARKRYGAYSMTGDDILEGLKQVLRTAEQEKI